MTYHVKIIGTVSSSLKKLEDCPRQGNENAPAAKVIVLPEYKDAMKDITVGDELILFTWLHQANTEVQITKPRNDENAPLTGVFSTRSPDRPNPIGMHPVTVIGASGNIIEVSGLEVLDQTPVIDIKPSWK